MTFNAACSTPQRFGLAIATLWLAVGARAGSEPGPVCPPVPAYSSAFQARAAEEVEALPEGAPLVVMMQDYAVMREQARACIDESCAPLCPGVADQGTGLFGSRMPAAAA